MVSNLLRIITLLRKTNSAGISVLNLVNLLLRRGFQPFETRPGLDREGEREREGERAQTTSYFILWLLID